MRDKREKFIQLAERRVSRLLRDLRLVGNLGNKNNYSYTSEDVRKIFSAIESELRIARKRLDGTGNSDDAPFKLR